MPNMTHQLSSEARPAHRKAGAIAFTNYALVDRIPVPPQAALGTQDEFTGAALQLDEHMIIYKNCEVNPADFIWGVHGTSSLPEIRALANAFAKKEGKFVVEVEGQYQLESLDGARSSFDEDATVRSGYLHAERLKASFRDDLKYFLLKEAPNLYYGFNEASFSKLSLGDLLHELPNLVQVLLEMDQRINMVVHRVRPAWNRESRRGIPVCTMRRIKKRIFDVKAKCLPGVRIHF